MSHKQHITKQPPSPSPCTYFLCFDLCHFRNARGLVELINALGQRIYFYIFYNNYITVDVYCKSFSYGLINIIMLCLYGP